MSTESRPGGLASRIQAMQDESSRSRGRALGWLLGAPVGAALWAVGAVEAPAGPVVVACALVASWWWLRDARRLARQVDDTVDEVILQGWEKAATAAVSCRLRTLLGPRYRRRLARRLATGVWVPLPRVEPSRPESSDQAALQRLRLGHVVELLEDVGRPVDPRGVILVGRLVSAAGASDAPSRLRDELGPALQRIERLI